MSPGPSRAMLLHMTKGNSTEEGKPAEHDPAEPGGCFWLVSPLQPSVPSLRMLLLFCCTLERREPKCLGLLKEGGRGSPGSGGESPQEPSPSMPKCPEQPKTMGTFWGDLVKLYTLVPAIPTAPSKIQTELGTPRWAQSPGSVTGDPAGKSPGVLTWNVCWCPAVPTCLGITACVPCSHKPSGDLGISLFLPALGQRMFPIGG